MDMVSADLALLPALSRQSRSLGAGNFFVSIEPRLPNLILEAWMKLYILFMLSRARPIARLSVAQKTCKSKTRE